MSPDTLQQVLDQHTLWLRCNAKGIYANLFGADLREADLKGANLRDANLEHADMQGANLQYADLRNVDLEGADLEGADLRWADLRGANLQYADLRDADLRGANLWEADLHKVDLEGANLHSANLKGRKVIYRDLIRCYILHVLPEVKDGPRFIAGCRNFSYDEAIYHWTTDSVQPEYIKAIEEYMKELKQ